MNKIKEYCIGGLLALVALVGYVGVSQHTQAYKQLHERVQKLEKSVGKDVRLDESIMQTSDGKKLSRIQVYDEITATIVRSLQNGNSNTKR